MAALSASHLFIVWAPNERIETPQMMFQAKLELAPSESAMTMVAATAMLFIVASSPSKEA
jgi:hypothetical protein